MRLTDFSDTARRVLLLTGAASEGTRLTTAAIAEGVSAPYHHVAKAVSHLSGLGPLASTRGRNGGIAITPTRLGASVGWPLLDLEVGSAMVACDAPGCQCPLVHDCRLRHAQAQAREAFYRALDDVHVPDLITATRLNTMPARFCVSAKRPAGECTFLDVRAGLAPAWSHRLRPRCSRVGDRPPWA